MECNTWSLRAYPPPPQTAMCDLDANWPTLPVNGHGDCCGYTPSPTGHALIDHGHARTAHDRCVHGDVTARFHNGGLGLSHGCGRDIPSPDSWSGGDDVSLSHCPVGSGIAGLGCCSLA